ncbi:bifunctional WD40 repeat/WD40-YVTN repeat-like-containing domain superfamily/Zinc finger [Babesia duncani]|uniref:Pre-mRNA-processing factor 19 n=1 Tax=Babesia duncani TaxID=323732 RepID=A0AAD9UMW8_9APIC|nr:bifunctional WD40 repeat/WD40-YVTN repeat-like-containing domain superfamily/Zinc finger [Babesia duncani]
MALICSISGVQPEEPCLSKTGYIFERRLIEKHLQESSVCPITGEPLTSEDLTPIKGLLTNNFQFHFLGDLPVKPRPSTASSIPGLLSLLQSEWDALALETFNLRSHVDVVRKQLSYNLYQHDAATRVIARLLKERDRAQQEIASLQKQLLEFRANYDIHAIEIGLDEDAITRLQDLAKSLMGQRKQRDMSIFTNIDAIKQFKLTGEYRTHSSTIPGINSVVVDVWSKSQDNSLNFCYTGGADGSIVYFDLNLCTTVSKMTNHLKAVNALVAHYYAPVVISGSDDKTIRVWRGDDENGEFKSSHILKHHKAPVLDLSLHPSGEYLLSMATDGVWGFCDLDSGKVIKLFKDLGIVCKRGKFHTDGLIAAGAGTDGAVHIWDFRQMSILNSLMLDSDSPCVDVDFSENGYYMAAIKENGILELWDLRKSTSFCTIDCNNSPTRVKFDPSGWYLYHHCYCIGRTVAVASTSVQLFNFVDKTSLEACTVFDQGHEGYLTDICFGMNAEYLLTTCRDRAMRIFS